MSMQTSTTENGLDTTTLEDAMKAMFLCVKNLDSFVIANNEMQHIDFSNISSAAIIQNIDRSHLPGSHWVAYYIWTNQVDGEKNWLFFDSYGKHPIEYFNGQKLKYLFSPPGKMVGYNKQVLQSNDSSLCGQFCLHFLYNMLILLLMM